MPDLSCIIVFIFSERENMQGERTDIDQSPKAFLERVKNKCKINEKGCWLWQGRVNNRGRPLCTWKNKLKLVYRHSYEAYYGKTLKEGLFACHTCDEKTCCNPKHIFEGNNQDNQLDFISKHGEAKNGWSSGDTNHYVDGRKKVDIRLQAPSNLTDAERFIWYRDKYCEHDENDCWIWLREVGQDGYGRVKYKNKKHQSHRIMWMLSNNKTPEDLEQLRKDNLVIGHMCPVEGAPNKACCNPNHLKVRTRSDNAIDARSYTKARKALHKDDEILEWLWIYEFVINELGEDHDLLITADGRRSFSFICDGLIQLGKVKEGVKPRYVKDVLRGKSLKHFHKEFFDWTPSWK